MVVIVPDPPGSADTLGLPYLRRSRSRTLLSHREPFVPPPSPLFDSFLWKESMRSLCGNSVVFERKKIVQE